MSGGGLGGLRCDGLDGDFLAEAFELCDESADVGLFGESAGEVVAAEVGVGLVSVEDVVGDDQDGVADRDGGAFAAAAPPPVAIP